jgi:opacity protein-like surface antigen
MKSIVTLSVLALLLLALPAAAQTYDWSNVGSVGITQAGAGYNFLGPSFTFAPSRTGTLTARYNVTNTVGGALDLSPAWTTFRAAFTDNSALGVVNVRLMQVDKCSNAETNICSISSSDGNSCDSCTFGSGTFDFANNFYYVEAKITRSSTSATEMLHSVAIN